MKKLKESLKTLVLSVLIATCLLQVGILWGNQNHRFPINFIQTFFEKPHRTLEELDAMVREDFFSPTKLIVFDGKESRFFLNKNSKIKKKLWDDTALYLEEAFNSSSIKLVDTEEWTKALAKKTFVFEFPTPIRADLIKWFIGKEGIKDSGIDNIYKLLLAPDASVNRNYNTLYIRTENKLYLVELPFRDPGLKRIDYDNIIKEIYEPGVSNYRIYSDTGYPFQIREDVLVQWTDNSKQMSELGVHMPYKVMDVEILTSILLDNQRESFDRIESIRSISFQNFVSIYRIHSNGNLEYRYIPGSSVEERGKIENAFRNTYKIINSIKEAFLPNTEIYLYSAQQTGDSYKFIFGYSYDGIPVYLHEDNRIIDVMVIEANEKRVISINWLLREFRKHHTGMFDSRFTSIWMGKNEDFSIDIEETAIKNIQEGYMFSMDERAKPAWIIETEDKLLYGVYMSRNEDN